MDDEVEVKIRIQASGPAPDPILLALQDIMILTRFADFERVWASIFYYEVAVNLEGSSTCA